MRPSLQPLDLKLPLGSVPELEAGLTSQGKKTCP
jgi:hypothetical protein